MPGIVKIGRTDRSPRQRAEELSSSTGVPTPFEVAAYAEVKNPAEVERIAHDFWSDERVSNYREFFRVEPYRVWRFLSDPAWADTEWASNDVQLAWALARAGDQAMEVIKQASEAIKRASEGSAQ
jgi:hypothetical protein